MSIITTEGEFRVVSVEAGRIADEAPFGGGCGSRFGRLSFVQRKMPCGPTGFAWPIVAAFTNVIDAVVWAREQARFQLMAEADETAPPPPEPTKAECDLGDAVQSVLWTAFDSGLSVETIAKRAVIEAEAWTAIQQEDECPF